jgi:hypothetical protein
MDMSDRSSVRPSHRYTTGFLPRPSYMTTLRARPLLASVHASLDVRAPTWQACESYAPPLIAGVRALPRWRVRPPTAMHAPLLAGMRTLTRRRAHPPPRWRAHPTPLACAPPAKVRAPSQTCAPCPPNTRALIAGGRTRYIRRGPSHPHFTTLGFVSWDSFVGSLHEIVGMVQHFRFLPF